MLKKLICVLLALAMVILMAGCGSQSAKAPDDPDQPDPQQEVDDTPAYVPPTTYESELTGLQISLDIRNQRPLAVMIDNEKIAYDHYGVAESDIVYELMNNTHNGRITRLMCIIKEWQQITQMGSIRSARPTNIILAGEYNAILCHDGGGPGEIKKYYQRAYAKERFNARFSRVKNGKPKEFTEYILSGDIEKAFEKTGYSIDYNEYAPERETHFLFVDNDTETQLENYGEQRKGGMYVKTPFPHNRSELKYNTETATYDYYSYGKLHVDAEDEQVLSFTNVILIKCSYSNFSNGYMVYDLNKTNEAGYYLTKGYCIPITWTKTSDTGLTRYYDSQGQELSLNRGKTYICIVPSDIWNKLVIEAELPQ